MRRIVFTVVCGVSLAWPAYAASFPQSQEQARRQTPQPAPTPESEPAAGVETEATATAIRPAGRERRVVQPPDDPTYGPHKDAIGTGLAEAATWRHLGPSNMGGRVTDLAVVETDPATFWVATAGGGLWKTTNNGTTWTHQFNDQSTVSIGDVCVDPNDPDTVWVGSGEENARNSVSFGDGIYKSTDGGATFTRMGLENTFQIGHIEIDPRDSDTVFVAALGRLWGPNTQRGVFRTRDGGRTWERVLYVDDKTGCIDVRVDPENPNIVYATLYERMRDEFDGNDPSVKFSEQSGFYKSTDGGDTWERKTDGLPTVRLGRTGLSIYRKNPATLFMTVETERIGWATGSKKLDNARPFMGIRGEEAEGGGAVLTTITDGGPSEQAGLQIGDVVLAVRGETITDYDELVAAIRSSTAEATDKIKVRRGEGEAAEELEIDITWGARGGGQGGGQAPHLTFLGGQNPNVQDQQGDDGFETGGIFRSDDRGETWTRINSLNDRPFYYSVIAVDPQDDRNIYSCGVPFFGSFDGGESFEPVHRGIHVDFHAIWVDPNDSDHLMVGCDGGLHISYDRTQTWKQVNNFPIGQFYHADVDQADPYNILGGLQDNGTWFGPSTTRWREGASNDDWVTIYGGDGFTAKSDPLDPRIVYATSQNGGIGRLAMAGTGGGGIDKPQGRYNWDTPFFLSPHNHQILYFAGTYACQSVDRGSNSEALSPRLGRTDRGTATAFAESPARAGRLFVGTDDGALWRRLSTDSEWERIDDRFVDLPGPRYVSSIEPSAHNQDRVYVTFEGHRSNDESTYVFVSQDGGDTWVSLADSLPTQAPCWVVEEDSRNENLLFLGTEFGCYSSIDRGTTWNELGDLPTVSVRDLAIQDRESDLVAATHSNGIFVCDITGLRQAQGDVLNESVSLFRPARSTAWTMRSKVVVGHDTWLAPNESTSMTTHLFVAEAPGEDKVVEILDLEGEVLTQLEVPNEPGLHTLSWNRRYGEGRRRRVAGAGRYQLRFGTTDQAPRTVWTLRPDPDGTRTPISQPTTPDTQSRPQNR
ncbi:MAG: PDZ domain-containing protein [Planctomycetota bacterium]